MHLIRHVIVGKLSTELSNSVQSKVLNPNVVNPKKQWSEPKWLGTNLPLLKPMLKLLDSPNMANPNPNIFLIRTKNSLGTNMFGLTKFDCIVYIPLESSWSQFANGNILYMWGTCTRTGYMQLSLGLKKLVWSWMLQRGSRCSRNQSIFCHCLVKDTC